MDYPYADVILLMSEILLHLSLDSLELDAQFSEK